MYAGVAQSVVQLIRNQQVVCSSHITSSRKKHLPCEQVLFLPYFVFSQSLTLFFYKNYCFSEEHMIK